MASKERFGRPYSEAFPSLSVVQTESRWWRGKPFCQWTNQEGEVAGYAEVTWLDPLSVRVYTNMFGTENQTRLQNSRRIEVVRRADEAFPKGRPVFLCPLCARRVEKIFLVHIDWGCRHCHNLPNRSTRLKTDSRKHEELRRLSTELSKGRPRYMRQQKYEDLQARRAELEAELANIEYQQPHEELRFRMTGEWLSAEDRRLQMIDEPGRPAWQPQDGTGFSGPYGFDANYPLPERELDEKRGAFRRPAVKPRKITPWLGG